MFVSGEYSHQSANTNRGVPDETHKLPDKEFFDKLIRTSTGGCIGGYYNDEYNLAGVEFPGIEHLMSTPELPKPSRGANIDKAMIGIATVGLSIAAIAPNEIAQAQSTPETTADKQVNIVFVGDSIGVGADAFGGLRDGLSELGNIVYDSHESRRLVLPSCDEPLPAESCITISDGVRVIESNAEAIRDADIVIIELGTNDSVNQYEANLRRVLNDTLSVGTQDGQQPIIIVPELFYTDENSTAEKKNEIAQLVINDFQSQNYQVRSMELKELNIPTSDGIHPTSEGARQLASAIINEVVLASKDPSLSIDIPETTETPSSSQEDPNLIESIFNNIRSLPDIIFGNNNTQADKHVVINTDLIDWNMVQQNDPALNQIISSVEIAEANQAQTEVATERQDSSPEVVSNVPGIIIENGEPRTYLGNHTANSTIVVNEGFGDVRDVGNGTYAQGNFDSRSRVNPESNNGEPAPLIAPVPGIVHLTETRGEGKKVVIEIGTDQSSGGTIIWYGTHLSEFAVTEGQIVLAGESLGISGQTGTATGVHHSTGLAVVPYGSWDEYLNASEALNPFDYMPNVDITCLETATDDEGEYCGPTVEGVYKSLPVHTKVLEFLQSHGYQIDSSENNTVEIDLSKIDWNKVIPSPDQPSIIIPAENSEQNEIIPEDISTQTETNSSSEAESKPDEEEIILIDPNLINWGELDASTPEHSSPIANEAWLQNIPQDTRDLYLWASEQPECATVDMRTVAAEDWVENRGWSPIDEDWSDNKHSSADAAGRFQFIPSTWFGRKGVGWDRVNDPSAYTDTAMARDGDGDGVRDPYNVYDQILAACVHNQGSAGLPITHGDEELTGDIVTDLQNLIFYKGNDTLLGHIANYNGDGNTASNVPLRELPYDKQNPEYIRLAAALLLSDFTQAVRVNDGNIEIIQP